MAHEIDAGHRALTEAIARYGSLTLSDANEADTRRKVIDTVLHEILGWTVDDIKYEERVSEDGNTTFADYVIRLATTGIIVEAKRAGAAFRLPSNRTTLKLGGVLSSGPISEAIRQARDYCRQKSIPFAVATNGSAWVVFPAVRTDGVSFEDTYARVFRDFADIKNRFVEFWELLSRQRVLDGNLENELLGAPANPNAGRRPLTLLKEPGYRLGRNSVFEIIEPAVVQAFSDEALLSNPDALAKCYVKSSERVKYDSRLNIYLADAKPPLQHKTLRVKHRHHEQEFIGKIEEEQAARPRFIVLLGPVGAGKTTFVHYVRNVSAAEAIASRIIWFYVDFKRATSADRPRSFIYQQLLSLIESDVDFNLGDWEASISPAYADFIANLKRGPLFLLAKADPAEFDRRIASAIADERRLVEPYVEAVLRYALTKRPGFLVIDNVDQIEDDAVQQAIFIEAQATARKVGLSVIISIRDSTYLRHRTSPAFDAFQFESFYVDAPQVAPVLSRRFAYAQQVIEGKSAELRTEDGKRVRLPNVAQFFEVVAQSVLSEDAGYLIEVLSGGDIRRGLQLVREFLASGHTTADKAILTYLSDGRYRFPRHEVFRGAVLGPRKYYREEESLLINIFDARLGAPGTQLLRMAIAGRVVSAAAVANFEALLVDEMLHELARVGIRESDALDVLRALAEARAIATADGLSVRPDSQLVPTRLAAYLVKELASDFTYLEFCLLDAAIYDDAHWERIAALTQDVEATHDVVQRIEKRISRAREFLSYMVLREEHWVVECKRRALAAEWSYAWVRDIIAPKAERDFEEVLKSARRRYGSTAKRA
jgi:hypothetical protein